MKMKMVLWPVPGAVGPGQVHPKKSRVATFQTTRSAMTSETCQGRHPGCGKSQKEEIRGGPRKRDTEEGGRLERWREKTPEYRYWQVLVNITTTTRSAKSEVPPHPRPRHRGCRRGILRSGRASGAAPAGTRSWARAAVGHIRTDPHPGAEKKTLRSPNEGRCCLPKRLSPTHKKKMKKWIHSIISTSRQQQEVVKTVKLAIILDLELIKGRIGVFETILIGTFVLNATCSSGTLSLVDWLCVAAN